MADVALMEERSLKGRFLTSEAVTRAAPEKFDSRIIATNWRDNQLAENLVVFFLVELEDPRFITK